MFFDDKKRAVTTMMAKRNGKGEKLHDAVPMKPEVVKDEQGEVDPRHLAAQDALAAFHEKSPDKFMQAMSNFIDLHNSRSEPAEQD